MTIDPSDLAEQLPDRPLKPTEVQNIADRFDASVQTVECETDEGTPYVPSFFMWVSENPAEENARGRALGIHMDVSLSEWDGEVLETDVTQQTWLKVNEVWAAEMGAESQIQEIVLDEGGEKTRRNLE